MVDLEKSNNFYYSPVLMGEKEAEALSRVLPELHGNALGTRQDASLTTRLRELASPIVERLIHSSDTELRDRVNSSSLADFCNVVLLRGIEDPRGPYLVFNIYPNFSGDTEFHTHRTQVSSFVMGGELRNSMFEAPDVVKSPDGAFEVSKILYRPGKSVLEGTGVVLDLPKVEPDVHTPGIIYGVPMGSFHSVTTGENTITLCLFRKNDDVDYDASYVMKSRDNNAPEPDARPLEGSALENIRIALQNSL